MRQTPDQINAAAARDLAWKKKREEMELTLTQQHADSISKMSAGGFITDPEIVASVGLANTGVDSKDIHQAVASSARGGRGYVPDTSTILSTLASNAGVYLKPDKTPYTLFDLFYIMGSPDIKRYRTYSADWVEAVDPGGMWRSVETPETVASAKDLLNLSEAQIVKMYLVSTSKRDGKWWSIPGMSDRRQTDERGHWIDDPSRMVDMETQALLRKKFPTYARLEKAELDQAYADPGVFAGVMAELQPTIGMLKDIVGLPFKAAGFFAPDFMKPVANVPKAGLRAVTTGFTAAAQLAKSTIEFNLTHEGPLDTFVAGVPAISTGQDLEDYRNTVIRGNVLSQIVKQMADPNQTVDLGSGFFPEGKAAEEARKAHDAGLPKIDGKTWTLGRATVAPLIRENWIDKDGAAAQVLSGLVDATFTVATDPSIYFDPAQALMSAFKLDRVAATHLLNGAKADIVRDAWVAERVATDQSTVINEVIDMIYDETTGKWVFGGTNIPAENIPKLAGVLPAGTELPEEVQKVVRELAQKEIDNAGPLAILDSPPDNLPYRPGPDTREGILNDIGVIDNGDGVLRADPMAIDNMVNTRSGKRMLQRLTTYSNAGELYDANLGNIPPGAAVQIQDVVDAARAAGTPVDLREIHRILVDGVLSADPMYGVQYVPSYAQQIVNQTGKQVAYYANKMSRQLATMPGSTFFTFDDPIGSINDMNRIMVIMKVPTAERHAFLSRALNAVTKEGPGARFELANDWMKTVVTPALKKNGVPDEWIKTITSWAGWNDSVHLWSMDAIGRGYPTPWLTDTSGDVLRTIDTMNRGFIMVPPDMMKQVIRETTNLWKIFKPLRGNRNVEKILNEQITKKLLQIQQQWMKPVAMGAPLPVRMVTRILPDELLRVAATGNMSSESIRILTAGGHMNYTTHGKIILSMKEITKLFPIKEHLDDLYAQLDKAMRANNGALAASLADEITKIEGKHGTINEIMEKIKTYQDRAATALPGANRAVAEQIEGLMAVERMDPRVMNYERNLNVQRAYKAENPEQWVVGTARDIVRMSMSKAYPEVAEAMLAGTQQALLDLPQRFLNGDLRPVMDELVKAFGNANPLMPLDSLQGITAYIGTVIADISTRTGMDPVALGVIQTGTLGGASIASNVGDDLWEASKAWRNWVKDNMLPNPATDNIPAPFHSTEATKGSVEAERWFTKAFSLYRDTSAKYARNPFMHYEKWKRIIELIPIMDPAEAQKMLAAIDATDAPDFLKESIRRAVPTAKGTATRKQVELLGDMHGHQRVADVLYDNSKKSYFGSKHGLTFGFFDAWREQWMVWARQIATQPSLVGKAALAKEALTNTGVIYKDEDTGQTVVPVPFSREVYNWLGLNAEERIPTKNLTLLSQAVPGAFGFGAIIMDSWIPKTGLGSGLRNVFFSHGDPSAPNRLADYFVPAWGQNIIGSVTRAVGGQKAGRVLDVFDNIESYFVGQQDERLRATTLNAVLTNLASNSGDVPLTQESREKQIADTEAKTNYLLGIKGLLRLVLPTASLTKYFTDSGAENVTTGVVMDDLRRFIDESQEYSDAVTKLLDKYGNDTWIYLAGGSQSVPGMVPSKEYAAWYNKNSSVVSKYPSVGGYFGPQGGDYDPSAFSAQRAAGYRQPQDIKVRQEKALNNLAWVVYKNTANAMIRDGIKNYGLTEEQVRSSAQFKNKMKEQADLLKKTYPMWNPRIQSGESGRELLNQMRDIEKMVKDKNILKSPMGKALAEYWNFRTQKVDQFTTDHPDMANETWKDSSKAVGFRQKLEGKAEEIIAKNPDFQVLWDNVLSREFTPSELG